MLLAAGQKLSGLCRTAIGERMDAKQVSWTVRIGVSGWSEVLSGAHLVFFLVWLEFVSATMSWIYPMMSGGAFLALPLLGCLHDSLDGNTQPSILQVKSKSPVDILIFVGIFV